MIPSQKSEQFGLLAGATSNQTGEWLYIGDWDDWTLVITGLGSGKIEVWVSNVQADSDQMSNREVQLDSDVTTSTVFKPSNTRFAFVRVKLTSHVSGTVYVDFHGYKA
jgi:hypothetical protein